MLREDHDEAASATGAILRTHGRAMQLGDGAHDREPEAAAARAGSEHAMEALEDALALAVGWLLALGSGTYLGNGLLAAAPGGIAEMSITAKVLRIGVAFVTAAHVVRYLIVVLFTIPMYRLLEAARVRAAPPK